MNVDGDESSKNVVEGVDEESGGTRVGSVVMIE